MPVLRRLQKALLLDPQDGDISRRGSSPIQRRSPYPPARKLHPPASGSPPPPIPIPRRSSSANSRQSPLLWPSCLCLVCRRPFSWRLRFACCLIFRNPVHLFLSVFSISFNGFI